MTAPLDQPALFELRHIVSASGADALWVYRDPRVIGRKLLVSLVDAGLVETCDEPGQEWTAWCFKPTDAGREAAR